MHMYLLYNENYGMMILVTCVILNYSPAICKQHKLLTQECKYNINSCMQFLVITLLLFWLP